MLASFSVINCLSILSMQVDFTFAEGKAPNGYRTLSNHVFLEIAGRKERLVPCLAFFGANASGKTNIIKALDVLKTILREGIEDNYFPNKLHTQFATTSLDLTFFVENVQYRYCIEYNGTKIYKETLWHEQEKVFYVENSILHVCAMGTPYYDEERLKNIFAVECVTTDIAEKYQIKAFLSIIYKNYSGLNIHISRSAKYLASIMIFYASKYTNFTLALDTLCAVTKSTKEENIKELVQWIKKFDIEITDIVSEKQETAQHEKLKVFKSRNLADLNVYTFHRDIDNNTIQFALEEESQGTQVLLELLVLLLLALRQGYVLIIDEIDKSLHPFIVKCIIKMCKDKTYNTNNAQLICTTHNTDILEGDVMRPSEIAIVTKILKKGTQVCRISDFPEIRNVHNFRKAYLSGELSGIPYPYL